MSVSIAVKKPCGYGCGKLISVKAFACQNCLGAHSDPSGKDRSDD